MKRSMVCLCLMGCFSICEADAWWGAEKISAKAERAQKTLEGFDDEITQSLNDYQIPGAAVGIVVDGCVVYSKGFGMRDREKKLPATPDTLFLIGSCTKAFTAFAMGCLVDEGLANWDDRIVDWLPEFRLSDQYVSQMLTIRDLLSHQTRLPRHDYVWYNSTLTREDVFYRLRYLELAPNNFERFHYNNLMYLVVGMAMEKIANTSWEDLISRKILTPLQMKHTGFSSADMKKSSNYALPYIEKENELKRMELRDFSLVLPAGGLFSNVNDLCLWIQLQLNYGEWQQKSLISLSTFKEMQSPQVVVTGYPESTEEQVRTYGLGWYVQSYRGCFNAVHDGTLDGYMSVISLLPQNNIGVVVLCNKNMTVWPRLVAMDAFDRVLELPRKNWLQDGLGVLAKSKETLQKNQKHECQNRKEGTSPSHPLTEYVGEYENNGYGCVRIECIDGKLQLIYNNLHFLLEHWHYDVFNICEEFEETLISLRDIKATFHNDLKGDVSELLFSLETDVVFTRKPEDSLSDTAYLRSFTGTYEIYSYIIEIVLRNQTLYAIIPGQPMYELIPIAKNEFAIRTFTGSTVRFVKDANDKVGEARLIQPYGLVYTAYKKN